MTYYLDMDGVLANFHAVYATDRTIAMKREAMATLPVFEENVKTLRKLIAEKVTCYILTKAANEEAKQGKIEWLQKYVPELTAEKFICIVGYGRKIDYIREDGTLIDDDEKNTKQWTKGGQKAILLTVKGEVVKL